MRTFLLVVLGLAAADVLLAAPASRVVTVFGRPTHWLAAWMDAGVPLIPQGHLSTAPAGKGGGGGTPKGPGKCPPGSIWDPKTQTCLKELG